MFSGRRSWRNRLPEPALLLLIAYAILLLAAAPGMVWTTDKFNDSDEGQHLYALDRLAKGQVPYIDLYYLYGPSTLYSLYVPYKLFGQNLASVLFATRVLSPILTLLVVFLIGRLVLQTSRGRFMLLAAVLAANAHVVFWCPGYRVWLNLLAIAGFASCLFRPAGLSSFLWGILISLGMGMSAEMTVMTAICLIVVAAFAVAAGGLKMMVRPLIVCLIGMLSGSLLLWSAPLLHGGLRGVIRFNAALLSGTNWYGGLVLPWPWEVFAAPFRMGIIYGLTRIKGFISIYWYFTVLICTVTVALIWTLRHRSDQDLPHIRASRLGFVAASLVLARVVLGRVNEFDHYRLALAAAPLLILMVMYFEHLMPRFEELLRKHFPGRRVARYAGIYLVTITVSVAAGLAFIPFLSVFQAVRATLSLIEKQLNPPGSVVLVSGIQCSESSPASFWNNYARTYSYLRKHAPPGAYLYVCPWGPYNAFLDLPNPTRIDILDNAAPDPNLRREMVNDLLRHKPEYIVLRRAWFGEMSTSNNPELVTREIRVFTEQYYTQVVQFGLDTLWRLKQSPDPPFKPEVAGTWTNAGAFMPKSQGWPPGHLLAFKMSFSSNCEADTVELKLKVTYPFWARSLAKGRLRLKIEAPTGELYSLGIPSDGQIQAIRFYLTRIMPLRQVEFELVHPGLFNFAPESIKIVSLSLYRTGGRAFE